MTRVTYISDSGDVREVKGSPGQSIMQVAVSNDIDGIIGRCGGGAMCGTCHVYLDPDDADGFPPRHEIEDELLAGVPSPVTDCSRLGCQLVLTSQKSVQVRTPAEQD